MTPIYQRLIKRLTFPIRDREVLVDDDGRLRDLAEIHCFEVSEVIPLALDMAEREDIDCDWRATFLPAPRTMIEFRTGSAMSQDMERIQREAFLLERTPETPGDAAFQLTYIGATNDGVLAAYPFGFLHVIDGRPARFLPSEQVVEIAEEQGVDLAIPTTLRDARMLAHLLTIINTPRVIGRAVHQPHKGLARSFSKLGGTSFPLRAWTEILLRVRVDEGGEVSGRYLTGAKALHFVRSFGRVRLGKLEIVRAHWRGDASLGIKRSTYRVEA